MDIQSPLPKTFTFIDFCEETGVVARQGMKSFRSIIFDDLLIRIQMNMNPVTTLRTKCRACLHEALRLFPSSRHGTLVRKERSLTVVHAVLCIRAHYNIHNVKSQPLLVVFFQTSESFRPVPDYHAFPISSSCSLSSIQHPQFLSNRLERLPVYLTVATKPYRLDISHIHHRHDQWDTRRTSNSFVAGSSNHRIQSYHLESSVPVAIAAIPHRHVPSHNTSCPGP